MSTKTLTKAWGFSLIELMVVIAIVALLAAVAVPSYKGYIARSNAAEINSLIGSQLSAWTQAKDTGATIPSGGTLGAYITSYSSTSTTMSFVFNSSITNLDAALAATNKVRFNSTSQDPYAWSCEVLTSANAAISAYPTNGPLFGLC